MLKFNSVLGLFALILFIVSSVAFSQDSDTSYEDGYYEEDTPAVQELPRENEPAPVKEDTPEPPEPVEADDDSMGYFEDSSDELRKDIVVPTPVEEESAEISQKVVPEKAETKEK